MASDLPTLPTPPRLQRLPAAARAWERDRAGRATLRQPGASGHHQRHRHGPEPPAAPRARQQQRGGVPGQTLRAGPPLPALQRPGARPAPREALGQRGLGFPRAPPSPAPPPGPGEAAVTPPEAPDPGRGTFTSSSSSSPAQRSPAATPGTRRFATGSTTSKLSASVGERRCG